MGRPTITRSIKRNRLRALKLATKAAGMIAPTAVQAIAKACEKSDNTRGGVYMPDVNESYDEGFAAGLAAAKKAAKKKSKAKRVKK